MNGNDINLIDNTTNDNLLLEFSSKQLEYINNANKRWNMKFGATQCGKTFVDTTIVIYERLRAIRGKNGLRVIMGVSQSTIERNVLKPMREFWGSSLVGEIRQKDNAVKLFGETVYCIGAEKSSQVAKLRGMRIAYCYGDEATDWSEEVFELLKSRLSLPYSTCDLTGNPKNPSHFIKRFMDTAGLSIYQQHWTLYDNPFLEDEFIRNLEAEYKDTIYFNRYILGEWKRAEGIIYKKFADNPKSYIIDKAPPLMAVEVGIDFGGNRSKHAFTAVGFTMGYRDMIVLESQTINTMVDPDELNLQYTQFATMVYNKYSKAFFTNYDSAEPVLGRGITLACIKAGCRTNVRYALKKSVNERIRTLIGLLGSKRLWVLSHCKNVIDALQSAVWNPKALNDERLDDGSTDIDTLDSLEYAFERYIVDLQRGALLPTKEN